jgi:hypothetical protein
MNRRRKLVVRLVIPESEDSQRERLHQTLFSQQHSEDGAHLLEAQCDLAAFFFAGIGNDGEMCGVDFEPRRGL